MKLSEPQRRALEAHDGFLTDERREWVAVTRGITSRTFISLRNAGLLEQYEAGYQDWRCRLTDAGRKALEETRA